MSLREESRGIISLDKIFSFSRSDGVCNYLALRLSTELLEKGLMVRDPRQTKMNSIKKTPGLSSRRESAKPKKEGRQPKDYGESASAKPKRERHVLITRTLLGLALSLQLRDAFGEGKNIRSELDGSLLEGNSALSLPVCR